jgi:p-aminobenzoyl-glutamate transporter AbgT
MLATRWVDAARKSLTGCVSRGTSIETAMAGIWPKLSALAEEELMANEKSVRKPVLYRFLDWVERTGNKLPHPFMMFVVLMVTVIILSAILGAMKLEVKHPSKDSMVVIRSLLSADGIKYMFIDLTKNFVGFAPLGLVLTMMLGIGLAEQVGLMNVMMKRFISAAPKQLLVPIIMLRKYCLRCRGDHHPAPGRSHILRGQA